MAYLAEHSLDAAQQLIAGRALILEVLWTDQLGEPAAAAGTVTVGIEDAAGAEVLADGTATTADSSTTGRHTVALSAAVAGDSPRLLRATWTDGTSTLTTYHELVGAVLFSVGEARAAEPDALRDDRYSAAEIQQARRVVDAEFAQVTGLEFTRRYRRRRLDGSGTPTLVLPWGDLEPAELISARIYSDATSYTALTADELAAVHLNPAGLLQRLDGASWPLGTQNVLLELVVGMAAVPPTVKQAAIRRARQVLGDSRSSVPFNAISWTPDSGITYRLSTPGATRTGDPIIDAVLERFGHRARPF